MKKCDFDIVKKAKRKGVKYTILKIFLKTRNVHFIYFIAMIFSLVKRNLYINYK